MLSENQLTGIIPTELGNLTALRRLLLQDNQLTGSLPAEFANLASLEELRVYTNQLFGDVAAAIGGTQDTLITVELARFSDGNCFFSSDPAVELFLEEINAPWNDSCLPS